MGLLDSVSSAVTGGANGATAGSGPDVTPGTIAAWAVSFHEDTAGPASALLTVGSETYDGSVTATLPADLAGGSYQIVVEGMTDEDYAKIRLPLGRQLAASLYLWWKDSPSGILGDLARVTGLTDPLGAITPDPPKYSQVAELRIDSLRRRAGERRYEAVATGRERAFARLEEASVSGLCYTGFETAAQAVARAAGVTVVTHGLEEDVPTKGQPKFARVDDGSAKMAINTLADQAAAALDLGGLPMAVIRDGVLHVGKWNSGPPGVALDRSRKLDESGGLVAVDRGPNPVPASAPNAGRATVTVTTLGRPDLKPGDRVSLPLPPEDFPTVQPTSLGSAVLASVTGPLIASTDPDGASSTCLVRGVTHRISRTQGFITSFQALVLGANDDGWDPAKTSSAESRARGLVAADPAASAASAFHDHLRQTVGAAADRTRPRIGQIRDHAVSDSVPRHTSNVWYSTTPPDGRPVAAQRTTVTQEQHGELQEIPYLTPFAWGSYGLVLPRYPGTRVLLANAGGGAGDVVDLGAVWSRDAGPDAEPGDYWLMLPVGVDQREHLIDGDGTAPDGPASHDLIDGDGARLIETTRFIVRVTDQPTASTTRPELDADNGSVLIETKPSSGKSASILLKDDGSVIISATSITFDTSGQGDITLKANNVKVQVSGTMEVD